MYKNKKLNNKKHVGAFAPSVCPSMKARQKNGITLIALIITIVIMLILASVTIKIAKDGGLFDYAKSAKKETENAISYEQSLINEIYNLVDDNVNDTSGGNIDENRTLPYIETKRDANGCVTANATYESDGKTAIIPLGFKVSEKDGEKSIDGGLVIQDKNGNEFVWIPCTTNASDGSGLTLYAQDKKYNDGTVDTKEYYYKEYSDWKDEGGNTASVEKYKGFYVGRYEAGIPENAPFFGNTAGAAYTYSGRNTNAYVPVSKAKNPSWNGISQINAKEVSKLMYGSSKSVTSSLIDSFAWDTIVNWMESKKSGIATNSTNYGNYVDSNMSLTDALYAEHTLDYSTWTWKVLATNYKRQNLVIPARTGTGEQTIYEIATGSADKTKVQNIYDMAGNMWEWTTEVGNHGGRETATQFAVRRGGGFNELGANSPLSYRHGNHTSANAYYSIGFRAVLYIK